MTDDGTDEADVEVVHNEDASRFEAAVNGGVAFAEYVRDGPAMIFTHTEVPSAVRGQGIANRLARTALEYARGHDVVVVPGCRFIAAYIDRHPEYQSLTRHS